MVSLVRKTSVPLDGDVAPVDGCGDWIDGGDSDDVLDRTVAHGGAVADVFTAHS